MWSMRDITCSQTPSANYESIHTAFENYNYHLATSYLHTSNNCCEDSSATSVSRLAIPSWYYHLDLQKKKEKRMTSAIAVLFEIMHTARITFARSPPGTTVGGLPEDAC